MPKKYDINHATGDIQPDAVPYDSATQEFPLPGVSSLFWASHEPYGVTGFCPFSGQPQQTPGSTLVNAMRAAPTLLL